MLSSFLPQLFRHLYLLPQFLLQVTQNRYFPQEVLRITPLMLSQWSGAKQHHTSEAP